jgi:hypothetical protein
MNGTFAQAATALRIGLVGAARQHALLGEGDLLFQQCLLDDVEVVGDGKASTV